MSVSDALRKLEQRWRLFSPGTTAAGDVSVEGLLSHAQRAVLRGDVERMEAAVSFQKHNGFKALEEVAGQLFDGTQNALVGMDAARFRGPRGLETKGRALGIELARPANLVKELVERGATAQRLLNEDNAARTQLASGRRRVTRT